MGRHIKKQQYRCIECNKNYFIYQMSTSSYRWMCKNCTVQFNKLHENINEIDRVTITNL